MSDNGSDDDKLVFRYSRQDRLRNAAEDVRALNDPRSRRRPSLFQTLTPNRASAFLLLAIIMLSLTIVVTNLLVPSRDEASLSGNRFKLSAFAYDGDTYVTLKKTRGRASGAPGPMLLQARLLVDGEEGASSFTDNLLITDKEREEYRFRLTGTAERVEVRLESEDAGRTLIAKIE
jgi:hypothetical protein